MPILMKKVIRIVASAKVDRYLSREKAESYQPGDRSGHPWSGRRRTSGFKAIIENKHSGLLYDSEIFSTLQTGDETESIRQAGARRRQDRSDAPEAGLRKRWDDFSKDTVIAYIDRAWGHGLALHDKSPAEEIYDTFSVSARRHSRKAVGDLYKKRLILFMKTASGLVLANPEVEIGKTLRDE